MASIVILTLATIIFLVFVGIIIIAGILLLSDKKDEDEF